jgi:hypothetical protein
VPRNAKTMWKVVVAGSGNEGRRTTSKDDQLNSSPVAKAPAAPFHEARTCSTR